MSSSMTKFSKVEDEALVECIAKYPPIYNPQNKNYKDLNIRDAIWKNIICSFTPFTRVLHTSKY
ncbi:hypothetical protein QTP88_029385 [Uroleucon formosanum]